MDFVQVLATLFAKIFIGRALGAEDADTGAMLPDFANIALNEEAGNVFSELNGGKEVGVGPIYGRATRIVFGATETANCLILFLEVIASIHHVKIIWLRSLIDLVVLAAFSSSGEEGVVEIFERL